LLNDLLDALHTTIVSKGEEFERDNSGFVVPQQSYEPRVTTQAQLARAPTLT